MDGRYDGFRPLGLHRHAALLRHTERGAEERFRSRCAEAEDDAGSNERDLVGEPGETRAHFGPIGRLVNASLRSCFAGPLEVFYGVGDVDVVAVDAGRLERAVEQPASRSDERASGAVLGVSGLFTDDEQRCAGGSFAENGLGAERVQVTAATVFGRGAQLGDGRPLGNEVSRRAFRGGSLRCFSRLRHAAGGLPGGGGVR